MVAHPAKVAGEGAVQVAGRVRACAITVMFCLAGGDTLRKQFMAHDGVTGPAQGEGADGAIAATSTADLCRMHKAKQ